MGDIRGRKVILLGGSDFQTVAVKRAKEMGLQTILLDMNPNCSARKYADVFEAVSTNDRDAIIRLAKEHKVDGIVCYESDQSILTSSWVCEQLGLPGQPYEAVKIMQNKSLFRKYLLEHGFHCPKSFTCSSTEDALSHIFEIGFPLVIKPEDSCGSVGVTVVSHEADLEKAITLAQDNAKSRKVVIEEFIACTNYQLDGDAFSINGKIVFLGLGNQHKFHGDGSALIISGISFPSMETEENIQKTQEELQKLFNLLHLRTGAYNVEVMIRDGKPYIMECSPRNGGNLIPEVLYHQRGVDLVAATIYAALGEEIEINDQGNLGFYSSYIVRNNKNGLIKNIIKQEENVLEWREYYKPGDEAPNKYKACCAAILKFYSMHEMLHKMDHMSDFIKVEVESSC